MTSRRQYEEALPHDVWVNVWSFLVPTELQILEQALGADRGSIANPACKEALLGFFQQASEKAITKWLLQIEATNGEALRIFTGTVMLTFLQEVAADNENALLKLLTVNAVVSFVHQASENDRKEWFERYGDTYWTMLMKLYFAQRAIISFLQQASENDRKEWLEQIADTDETMMMKLYIAAAAVATAAAAATATAAATENEPSPPTPGATE